MVMREGIAMAHLTRLLHTHDHNQSAANGFVGRLQRLQQFQRHTTLIWDTLGTHNSK